MKKTKLNQTEKVDFHLILFPEKEDDAAIINLIADFQNQYGGSVKNAVLRLLMQYADLVREETPRQEQSKTNPEKREEKISYYQLSMRRS